MNQCYQLKDLDKQLKDFKMLLLSAPQNQIDNTLKEKIKRWTKVPEAIEVLEVIDYAVFYSLASDYSLSVLEIALKVALENEQQTMEKLLSQAWWRN